MGWQHERFETNVPGAEVSLDGIPAGVTPFQLKMSNRFWIDPVVLVKKVGYKVLQTQVVKEIKIFNVVTGYGLSLFTWFIPLLWSNGPKGYQYYVLIQSDAS